MSSQAEEALYKVDYAQLFTSFQKAHGLVSSNEITALECFSLGNLVLTSGHIMACDPFYCGDYEPFACQSIQPGQYPVVVSAASFGNKDQRIALAALILREQHPTQWNLAAPAGEDDTYGYCVDSGVGCFMDADAARIFAPLCGEEYDEEKDPIAIQWPRDTTHKFGWANACLDKQTSINIIAFSSGWGDGCYTSYFSYDDQGDVVCLLTDFGVLDEVADSGEK